VRHWVEERITDVLVWDVETVEKLLRVGARMVDKVCAAVARRLR
jgi:hypothetical protein